MTTRHTRSRVLTITVVLVMMLLGVAPGIGVAATAPVKFVLRGTFGREVNLTEVNAKAGPLLEDTCTVESEDTCQRGTPSAIPGGYSFPRGVAVTPGGEVFVADTTNNRVQELTSEGQFVLMFGREVDASTKGDLCTAASHDVCQAGAEGREPGELDPRSIAVDPSSGDVYVADMFGGETEASRVQAFTATGQFVFEIGKGVNETTHGNLCTQAEVEASKAKCGAPLPSEPSSSEPGVLHLADLGDQLTIGGSEHLLYVGDEHRVQEFKPDGAWVREIPPTTLSNESLFKVTALAVDQAGDLYLTYGGENVIREFGVNGEELEHFEVAPRQAGAKTEINALAIDSTGRLAVSVFEAFNNTEDKYGLLYNAASGHLLTGFQLPAIGGIGLAVRQEPGHEELYAASTNSDVLAYKQVPVAELLAGAPVCKPGAEVETDVTLDCVLAGEVNPEGVSETSALFEWGRTCALTTPTPAQEIPTGSVPVAVGAPVAGLRPNETFCQRLVGFDANVKAPERLSSEDVSFATLAVAAKPLGAPSASFVSASSAVLFSELNPENATTSVSFQYAPQTTACPTLESCPGVLSTPTFESSAYGQVGVTLQASGLQPATTYRYRLLAESENTAKTEKLSASGTEGSFTTLPAPVLEAVTGPAGGVSVSGATLTGTVNPNGKPAVYTFELGVDDGGATQYAPVFSGATGASPGPVSEALVLSALQPATSYAYRIAIRSGYGSAMGAPSRFTTQGLPVALTVPVVLPQLALPGIAFPATVVGVAKNTTKSLTSAQRLARALRACRKKRSRGRRVACEKQAQRKYAPSKHRP